MDYSWKHTCGPAPCRCTHTTAPTAPSTARLAAVCAIVACSLLTGALAGDRDVQELLKYDVIITTYNLLALECPAEEAARVKQVTGCACKRSNGGTDAATAAATTTAATGKRKRETVSPLFQMSWFRYEFCHMCWDGYVTGVGD